MMLSFQGPAAISPCLPPITPHDPFYWKSVLREVADKHETTVEALTGPRKDRPLAHARQEAMWRLKRETTMSLPAIGRRLKRDHTTVLHGVRAYQERLDKGLVG